VDLFRTSCVLMNLHQHFNTLIGVIVVSVFSFTEICQEALEMTQANIAVRPSILFIYFVLTANVRINLRNLGKVTHQCWRFPSGCQLIIPGAPEADVS
jgi:hypothetical protein